MIRRTLLPLAALLCLAAPAVADDGLAVAAPKPAAQTTVDFEQRLGETIPLDLVFRDENAQRITLRECVGGKPTILVFAYYRCPMLCTQVLNGLVDAMRAVPYTAGKDFNVITVTFDPREQPDLAREKKKAYLAEYGRDGAENGWRFLTAEPGRIGMKNIEELTQAAGFKYEYDKAFKEYNHASGIMILTPEGKLSRYFYGDRFYDRDKPDPSDNPTYKTFRLSLVEAGEGKIGSPVDKLLLFCYRFDHLSKGYALNVMRVVKISGAATVLILAAAVVFLLRRGPRVQAAPPAIAPADGPAGGAL